MFEPDPPDDDDNATSVLNLTGYEGAQVLLPDLSSFYADLVEVQEWDAGYLVRFRERAEQDAPVVVFDLNGPAAVWLVRTLGRLLDENRADD